MTWQALFTWPYLRQGKRVQHCQARDGEQHVRLVVAQRAHGVVHRVGPGVSSTSTRSFGVNDHNVVHENCKNDQNAWMILPWGPYPPVGVGETQLFQLGQPTHRGDLFEAADQVVLQARSSLSHQSTTFSTAQLTPPVVHL